MDTSGLQSATPRRYLFRRPKALHYFHNGQLKRENAGERQAGRFELFLDLLYVALVANLAEDLVSHPSGAQLVKYILTFAPAWHIWSDIREIMNCYYNDDLAQRLLILWLMALLVLYGNNATLVSDSIGALRTTLGAFMTARLTTVFTYFIYSFASFQHRIQARILAAFIFVGLLLWIPLHFETFSIRAKIAVAAVAIAWQEISWTITFGPWIKRRLHLEYSTAVDIDHEIDRLAAFFIIVLGEFLYSIIVDNPAAIGLGTGIIKAVWTLIIAFRLNWLYVNADGSVEYVHPIRRSTFSAFAWFSLHLPLYASLLVGGRVCAASVSVETLEQGERWLMCGGLGVGMFCLWILATLFKTKDPGLTLMLPKIIRMAPRLAIAIILVLLPLTSEEQLDPVQLLSIVMALFAFAVVWETVGGLERGASIWEPWEGRNLPSEGRGGLRDGEPG